MSKYVYITTNGCFIVEGLKETHTGSSSTFTTTLDINSASLFNTPRMIGTLGNKRFKQFNQLFSHCDYCGLKAQEIRMIRLMNHE